MAPSRVPNADGAGRVGDRARQPLRRLVGELELPRAQRLDRRRIDPLLGEKLDRLAAPGVQALAHRQQVPCRLLHDRLELALLLLAGVDLDIKVLQHAVEPLLQCGRVDRAAAVAAMLRVGLETDGGRDAPEQRRQRDASESIHDCSCRRDEGQSEMRR
jgi:hypothetical protein